MGAVEAAEAAEASLLELDGALAEESSTLGLSDAAEACGAACALAYRGPSVLLSRTCAR